ncbi:MAG: hypothetical protein AVDCRST_MAG07-3101, partial [uncultured Frankineae bacterium]
FAATVAADLPAQEGATGGAGPVVAGSGCARAAWSGPQTRSRIEAILCDARISRVLLDSVGQVQRLESLTDSITPAQRRMLAVRDSGCVARGCTRPPALCDAHHLVHRADAGPTCLDNLVLLCRRHHVQWHQGKITHRDLRIPWHHSQQPDQTSALTPPRTSHNRPAERTDQTPRLTPPRSSHHRPAERTKQHPLLNQDPPLEQDRLLEQDPIFGQERLVGPDGLLEQDPLLGQDPPLEQDRLLAQDPLFVQDPRGAPPTAA